MTGDFGAAVARIAGMFADPWDIERPEVPSGPSAELQRRRAAGRAAYMKAAAARGESPILACAAFDSWLDD